MTIDCSRSFAFGHTEIGPGHLKQGLPNQDFFKIAQKRGTYVLSVADGVGSSKHARFASRRIAKVFSKIVLKAGPIQDEAQMREVMDRCLKRYRRVFSFLKKDMKTTFLGCLVQPDGHLFLAQAGDGLIGLKVDGKYQTIKEKDDQFGNFVKPISGNKPFNGWKILEARAVESVDLLLCTDGISGDINSGKEEAFLSALISKVSENGKDYIESLIKGWPTPHCIDDKTIVLGHMEFKNE